MDKPNGHKHVQITCASCGFVFLTKIVPEVDRHGYFVGHVRCENCGIELVIKDIQPK